MKPVSKMDCKNSFESIYGNNQSLLSNQKSQLNLNSLQSLQQNYSIYRTFWLSVMVVAFSFIAFQFWGLRLQAQKQSVLNQQMIQNESQQASERIGTIYEQAQSIAKLKYQSPEGFQEGLKRFQQLKDLIKGQKQPNFKQVNKTDQTKESNKFDLKGFQLNLEKFDSLKKDYKFVSYQILQIQEEYFSIWVKIDYCKQQQQQQIDKDQQHQNQLEKLNNQLQETELSITKNEQQINSMKDQQSLLENQLLQSQQKLEQNQQEVKESQKIKHEIKNQINQQNQLKNKYLQRRDILQSKLQQNQYLIDQNDSNQLESQIQQLNKQIEYLNSKIKIYQKQIQIISENELFKLSKKYFNNIKIESKFDSYLKLQHEDQKRILEIYQETQSSGEQQQEFKELINEVYQLDQHQQEQGERVSKRISDFKTFLQNLRDEDANLALYQQKLTDSQKLLTEKANEQALLQQKLNSNLVQQRTLKEQRDQLAKEIEQNNSLIIQSEQSLSKLEILLKDLDHQLIVNKQQFESLIDQYQNELQSLQEQISQNTKNLSNSRDCIQDNKNSIKKLNEQNQQRLKEARSQMLGCFALADTYFWYQEFYPKLMLRRDELERLLKNLKQILEKEFKDFINIQQLFINNGKCLYQQIEIGQRNQWDEQK